MRGFNILFVIVVIALLSGVAVGGVYVYKNMESGPAVVQEIFGGIASSTSETAEEEATSTPVEAPNTEESAPKAAPKKISELSEPKNTNELAKELNTELPQASIEVDYDTLPYVVSSAKLSEREIDIHTAVLVRCLYATQFYSQSSQPEDELIIVVGSGVFVSSEGHILTAAHVVRKQDFGIDQAGRIWTFDKCQIARTKDFRTSINSNPKVSVGSADFEDVEIIFEPSDTEYQDSNRFDVAVLKLKNPTGNDYVSLYPQLISFPKDMYSLIVIGYPGKDIHLPQNFERFDGVFLEIGSREGSGCSNVSYTQACGWRYSIARAIEDITWFGWTEAGTPSTSARPGFSGAPAFHKGYLVGLATHGKERDTTGVLMGIDFFSILTSRDISQFLSEKGFSF